MFERVSTFARAWMIPAVVASVMFATAQTSLGQCEIDELLASDGSQSDFFGISVSISGEVGIIGARNDDANGYASGSAYIFVQDGLSWIEQAKLLGFGWRGIRQLRWISGCQRRFCDRRCPVE